MSRMTTKTQDALAVTKYDIGFQMFLLSQIFSSGELYSRCKNILKPEYFDKDFTRSIEYVNAYTHKHHGTMPTLEEIKAYCDFEFQPLQVESQRHQAVLDSTGQYCKHKALALAVQESMELVTQKRYGGIEQLIKEAMLVSIQNELGLNIYDNPEQVIETQKQMQASFQTGWETLDYKLFGGFGRQELEIFAAASGGGKSVVLQNLAVNFSRSKKHGAYITLELAEELVATRIYGMMVDQSLSVVKGESSSVGTAIKTEKLKDGNSDIYIHRMPETITTVNDIESYLRELEIKTETKLDYVCVDYLDLLTSDLCGPNDRSNAFIKDKFVSEELRALARKMDITVITACQFNRNGVSEEGKDVRSTSQIAGGISKVYTADNVIFIDAKKERGELWFDFQKTRNSSAVGSKLRMAYSMDSLRIFDHEETVNELGSMPVAKPFVHSNPANVRGFGNILAPVKFSGGSYVAINNSTPKIPDNSVPFIPGTVNTNNQPQSVSQNTPITSNKRDLLKSIMNRNG